MTRTNRKADRDLLLDLADVLSVSRGNVKRDVCGDWNVMGRRGHISTDGQAFYAYVQAESARRWNGVKRALGFLTLTQDGDDEGVLLFRVTPTADQAATIRKVLGLRRSTPLTDERREALRQVGFRSNFAGTKPPVPAAGIDLPEAAATIPHPDTTPIPEPGI